MVYNTDDGAMEQGTSKKLEFTPQGRQAPANGKTSSVRIASKEQFEQAQRKTSAQHAGLFRRLAK
jgi:hypothetical protein